MSALRFLCAGFLLNTTFALTDIADRTNSVRQERPMTILLVRHAIAEKKKVWKELAGKPDKLRPLTLEGRYLFKKAVPGIQKIVNEINHLYVSQYTRALQTAEIIKDDYSVNSYHSIADLNPGASLENLLNLIQTHQLGETLCLVGHRRDLEALLLLLLPEDAELPEKIKKGSMILLQTNDKESYQLVYHITQKQLAKPKALSF